MSTCTAGATVKNWIFCANIYGQKTLVLISMLFTTLFEAYILSQSKGTPHVKND